MSRARGAGHIFKPAGCKNWTIKFSARGRRIREATGTADYGLALRLLTKRLHELDTGRFVAPEVRRIVVADLAEDFLRDYRIQARKSLGHAERRWRLHLEPFFRGVHADSVTSSLIGKYVDRRKAGGASNAEINRELAALKRMFKIGHSATPQKVAWMPPFPKLKESKARSGFLNEEQFQKLKAAAGELWLRTYLEIAYTYAWRKSELLNLRVRQVDLAARTLRLEVGTTKNDEGREVALSASAYTLLQACIAGKDPDDYVFTRTGRRVKDFRGEWRDLCARAGVPGLLVHDLRRSAARQLRNVGVPEGVIMKIGGWKTRSVFDRYAIIVQSDVADAIKKLERNRAVRSQLGNNLSDSEAAPAAGKMNSSSVIN